MGNPAAADNIFKVPPPTLCSIDFQLLKYLCKLIANNCKLVSRICVSTFLEYLIELAKKLVNLTRHTNIDLRILKFNLKLLAIIWYFEVDWKKWGGHQSLSVWFQTEINEL